ncbi:MAG TPA: hypothetical protein VF263_04140 [Longimicrobiaceae bacterium]
MRLRSILTALPVAGVLALAGCIHFVRPVPRTGCASQVDPRAREIAFVASPTSEPTAIFGVAADGTGLTRLYAPSFVQIDWAPDASRIVFTAQADTGGVLVQTIAPDGSDLRTLPTLPNGTSTRWSPDCSLIAFVVNSPGRTGVSVVRPDGSGLRSLIEVPDDVPSGEILDWSPDGRRIAVELNDGAGGSDIVVVQADGSGSRVLTPEPGNDRVPQWSPDGRRIAFLSDREGFAGLNVMNADGSGVRHLAGNVGPSGGSYHWSPDGTRIVAPTRTVLRVVDVDAGTSTFLPDENGFTYHGPRWSPDGGRIAAIETRETSPGSGRYRSDLVVMVADGSGLRRLTESMSLNSVGPVRWRPR